MQLASFDQVPVYKVEHSKGMFIDQQGNNPPKRTLLCVIVDIRYGRKLFASRPGGKWGVDCVSPDALKGLPVDSGDVKLTCLDDPVFCDGCKPFLLVAAISEDGPILLELSATVAIKLVETLSPLQKAGLPLDTFAFSLKLGATKSSRVNFSQLVVNLMDHGAHTPKYTAEDVKLAITELDERHRSSFARPGKPAGKATIELGELSLPSAR